MLNITKTKKLSKKQLNLFLLKFTFILYTKNVYNIIQILKILIQN